jgi:DNA-binding transcriptional LysR family regulator
MELRELRSLVALHDEGSLRKVAAKLNLSPAAIHRQLKLLSAELGIQLYQGTRRQIRLTEAGAALCPLVRNLLLQYEAVASAALDWRGGNKGQVRMGAGPSFGHYVLPRLLEAFRAQSEQLIEELQKGHLDLLLIVPSSRAMKDFMVEKSWEFKVVLVAGTHGRKPASTCLADWKDTPYLGFEHGSYFQTIIDQYFASHGFEPRTTMRFNNAEPVKAMVQAGFGISMLPEWTLQEEIKNRQLRIIRQREEPLIACQSVLTRRNAYLSPAVKAFLAIAKSWDELIPPRRSR